MFTEKDTNTSFPSGVSKELASLEADLAVLMDKRRDLEAKFAGLDNISLKDKFNQKIVINNNAITQTQNEVSFSIDFRIDFGFVNSPFSLGLYCRIS